MYWKPFFFWVWLSSLPFLSLKDGKASWNFILFSSLQLKRLSSTNESFCVPTYNSGKEGGTYMCNYSSLPSETKLGRQSNYVRTARGSQDCFCSKFSPPLTLGGVEGWGEETVLDVRVNETDTSIENICHIFKLRNVCFIFFINWTYVYFYVCKTLRYFISNSLAMLSK